MSETSATTQIEDSVILADVNHLIAQYPPLTKDRHSMKVSVQDGQVTVSGHVQTANTRRYFVDHVKTLDGVKGLDASRFYDDNTIRLEVSKVLPVGLQANLRYGTVIITGEPPENVSLADLQNQILRLAGVEKVIVSIGG